MVIRLEIDGDCVFGVEQDFVVLAERNVFVVFDLTANRYDSSGNGWDFGGVWEGDSPFGFPFGFVFADEDPCPHGFNVVKLGSFFGHSGSFGAGVDHREAHRSDLLGKHRGNAENSKYIWTCVLGGNGHTAGLPIDPAPDSKKTMIETIEVAKRDVLGSRAMIKIREKGLVPAILYGHGEENVCLTLPLDTVNNLLKHGTKLVSLTGAVVDTALLRSVQWSSMGDHVIHVDFARVSQTEDVEVTMPIRLHGEAPGANTAAGQLRFVTHEIVIRCPARSIPEYLVCEIGSLQLGQSIHVSELTLPAGATAITPGAMVIVQVISQSTDADADTAATGAEPELIRKEKAADAAT